MLQVGVVAVFLAVAAIYAAPSVIAAAKGHRRWRFVVALNMLLGWTVAGWLLALAIALDVQPRRPSWARRKSRTKRIPARPPPSNVVDVRRDSDDPPEIREDVYATWLDQGAGLPASGQS